MRVLVLSQYYDPEPVPKAGEIARALRDRGHDVSVVTGFPNYPSGVLYAGYKLRLVSREMLEGIPVRRTWEYPYHGTSMLGRMLNYGSFALSAVLGGMFGGRIDVIYVWHPPLTIGIAAWLIGMLRRAPFVYDVQDIWPESALLSGLMRPGRAVRLMQVLEKFIYRRAAHLFVVTEGAKQNLIAKGVPPQRLTVMPHWIDEELFKPESDATRTATRAAQGWADDFVVLFAGNVGLVQGLDTVIEAAQQLSDDSRIRIVIVGDGADKARLAELTCSRNLAHRVTFMDRQPVESMPELMAGADALLVHLRRSDLSHFVIPTKTLAYLAAGKPIVMAMEGAAADLVRSAGAGVIVPSEDPLALAASIERLAQLDPAERACFGERGRAYLLAHLRKEDVLNRYEDHLKAATR